MPTTPPWLKKFTNSIAAHMQAVDLMPPIGCHYQVVDDVWEITLFAGKTEVLGGGLDGKQTPSQFLLDLEGITDAFDEVADFHWQPLSLGETDELGSHIAIEGTYEGHAIWLRILAQAPPRFQSGRYADTLRQDVKEIW